MSRHIQYRWPALNPMWVAGAVALIGYVSARCLDLLFMIHLASAQTPLTAEQIAWDGNWYRRIATEGYSGLVLTTTKQGYPAHTPYAFFPAYPYLVKWLSSLTGLGFDTMAVWLSLGLGAVAAVLMVAVLKPGLGAATAAVASVFWSWMPTSPLMGMAYTEALFSLEVVLFFWLLQRRRYLLIGVLLPVIGLSRGVVLPLAAVLAVHLVVRVRAVGSFRAAAWPAVLILETGVSAILWPAWVGHHAGRWDAYFLVQQAWVNGRHPHPSWWHLQTFLAQVHQSWVSAQLVIVIAGLAVVLVLALLLTPLGPELRAFGLVYLGYVLVLTPMGTSFYRFLLPLFTLAALFAWAARPLWARVLVLAALGWLQYEWIALFVARFPHGLTP